MATSEANDGVDRRSVLKTGALAGGAAAALGTSTGAQSQSTSSQTNGGSGKMALSLTVNGRRRGLEIDPRATLLDTLRHDLDLTGSKKGCDHGQCGACTVHVDGERRLACLTLAATVAEQDILTIEGLASGDNLHPMQQAFVDNDAFQCGYCTPGQIMSAVGLVKEGHAGSDAEIREHMSGNLCRCAAYPNIVDAVKQAAPHMGDA
ncbi:MAG: (2Fe-2S)-binding protein [Pacificimonas sp.]